MGRKTGRIKVNFRQTHSERSATSSYRNFGKFLRVKSKQRVPSR